MQRAYTPKPNQIWLDAFCPHGVTLIPDEFLEG